MDICRDRVQNGYKWVKMGISHAPHHQHYDYPGNVRELANAMKRVATLVRRPIVVATDLDFLEAQPIAVGGTDWLAGTLPEVVERVEIALIRRALDACAGNRAQAAERLGIRRQLLYQKLARYGLEASQNGTPDVSISDSQGENEPTVASSIQ